MEVKIGVQYAARELVIETAQSADEVAESVSQALTGNGGVLSLVDDKGRRVLVPAEKLGYVEITENEQRRVGFIGN